MPERKRRSEALTKEEHKALQKLLHVYHTKLDAADAIGVSRQVLDLVVLRGTGAPETIGKIKEALLRHSSGKAA